MDRESFDSSLQMFREPPRPVDLARLRFLRWLAEQDQLEHPPVGEPGGDLVQPTRSEWPPTAA